MISLVIAVLILGGVLSLILVALATWIQCSSERPHKKTGNGALPTRLLLPNSTGPKWDSLRPLGDAGNYPPVESSSKSCKCTNKEVNNDNNSN